MSQNKTFTRKPLFKVKKFVIRDRDYCYHYDLHPDEWKRIKELILKNGMRI